MDLDPYQPCPGGLDKKIKFCCKDLVHELDDISRKLEGGQLEAARSFIDQLVEKHGDRQCLSALGCSLALRLDDLETANARIQKFLQTAPDNPIALAMSAMTAAGTQADDAQSSLDKSPYQLSSASRIALDLLQQALTACGQTVPVQVYEAITVVGHRLMAEGHVLVAAQLFMLQAMMAGEQATEPISRLVEIGRSSVSALLKQELLIRPTPVGPAPQEYIEALGAGERGLWAAAAKQLQTLVKKHPDQPAYVRALAYQLLKLGKNEEAIRWLRSYATMEGVELDNAVEAEALAQLLDPNTYQTKTEIIEATFKVNDVEIMLAALQSDRRAVSMRADFSQMGGENGPPPKAGFWLLDRQLPEITDELTVDELPNSLGEVLLYGKETDRDARLQIMIARGDDYDLAGKTLAEIGGSALGDQPEERVLGEVSTAGAKLRVETHFPDGLPANRRSDLLSKRYQHTLLHRWTEVPLDVLDGKTPKQAAGDPTHERALLAAILILESGAQQHDNLELYNELRESLELPKPSAVSAFEDVRQIPLMRLSRLEPAMMNDDDLLLAYTIATQNSVWIPAVRLGRELIKRESISERINIAQVLGRLAKFTVNTDRALELIQEAQRAEVARGGSPAQWKISELGIRLATGDSTGAQQLLNDIQTRHMNEPGVQETLVQMLSQFGLIQPSGQPMPAADGGPDSLAAGPAGELLSAAAPPAGLPAAPSSPVPAPSQETGQKSKLWLPD